jgi:signal transduction histidine kinase
MFFKAKEQYRSSSLRLAATLNLVFVALLLLTWIITREALDEALHFRAETELWAHMNNLQANYHLSQESGLSKEDSLNSGLTLWGTCKDGENCANMPPEISTHTGIVEFDFDDAGLLGLVQIEGGVRYFVAVETEQLEYASSVLDRVVLLCILASLVISIMIGAVLARRSQKHIDQISEGLSQLASGNLETRLAQNSRQDDLARIAIDINSTAEKLQKLVEQTRNVGNHIAHDLRTPLTKLKVHVDAISGAENQTVISALNREISRMKEMIDAILRLAQIQAQQSHSSFQSIDLNVFADQVFETFSAVVEDQGKSLILNVDDAANINGDAALLMQAMANLIQNAINYGGDEITLFVESRAIGLADNGAGVDPSEFENIILPMVRLDPARQSNGSGLGLALVAATTQLHGAKLVLTANEPSGLVVRLVFSSK